MSASRKWEKFRKLSWAERGLILTAMIALPVTAMGVRFFGVKRWKRGLGRFAPIKAVKESSLNQMELAQTTAWLVKVASWNGPYRPNCLQRSLTLWWLLRRKGMESDLRIGVQKENGEVRGHAWIEYHGIVLNDSEDVPNHYHSFNDLEGII
jgi:hypothetical protein